MHYSIINSTCDYYNTLHIKGKDPKGPLMMAHEGLKRRFLKSISRQGVKVRSRFRTSNMVEMKSRVKVRYRRTY